MSRIVVGEKGLLRTVLVDYLAKIALLIKQTYADHRYPQIASGLELIPGHIAKSSRIDRERFAQHEFHAEIRDAGQGRRRMALLKPRRRRRRVTLGLQQVIKGLTEGRIGQHALKLDPRDRLQDNPRVLREFPQRRIKPPPHFVGAMIPRPAHIQGQLRQGIESLDFRGQKAVSRVADAGLFAHRFSFSFGSDGIPGSCEGVMTIPSARPLFRLRL